MPIIDDDDTYENDGDVEIDAENEDELDTTIPKKIPSKKEDDDPEYEDDEVLEEDTDADDDDEDLDDDIEKEDDIFEKTTKTSSAAAAMRQQQSFPQFSEDEDDDEEEEDDHYLQKFESEISKNIIADWHPELKSCNYDEIDILSRVVRDQTGTIIDPLHRTLPFITRYEKARILGERAKQLNSGAKPFVDVDESVIDGYLIALKEFEERKIPFIIKRPLPNGGCEYWKCKDLEVI